MKKLTLALLLLPFISVAQSYNFKPVAEVKNSSYRGLHIVYSNTLWLSGSKGHIAKVDNSTLQWEWVNPKGHESLDFRAIKGIDEKTAIAVNAGSPAFILKTINGGETWNEVYKNTDSAIFLDALSFWDAKNALVFGDPINNKLQLLRTKDAGNTWENASQLLPFDMQNGEASFAASNSTLKTLNGGLTWITTGGATSNIYFSPDYGKTWSKYACPIWQGESSTGVFSIDFFDKNRGVVVGGDYLKPTENKNNVLLTSDGGKTWKKPTKPVLGYRSAVAYINETTLLATGTTGTDISYDGGDTWKNISDIGFNTIQVSNKGKMILLAGDKGKVYQLEITP